ncbi:DNA replication and repair protein RecF [candidate division GN15 bacterium]|nr:DNA replication and repair protein RecF [candidate division GN15 bacterium]
MTIDHLTIHGFRNLQAIELVADPSTNIFYGANGSGKTNLLESIFVLCLARSQRGAKDKDMVSTHSDTYRVSGHATVHDRQREVAVAYQQGGRKKITIDGVTARASELFANFCAVSAGPEDSGIVSGSPSERRGFMDIYLSQLSSRHLSRLTEYQQVLSQKNAALRDGLDPDPFNELLIATGTQIMVERAEFVGQIAVLAAEYYQTVAAGRSFTVRYAPSVSVPEEDYSPQLVEDAFRQRLASVAQREEILQSSQAGPHRDELVLEIDGLPARTCGSQGERRSAVLALKLAVYEMMKHRREMDPVLLLDEVFAELDENRTNGLIDAFGSLGQVFLTTAGQPPARLEQHARAFRITEGTVLKAT